MDTIKRSEITPVEIGPKRTRYLAYTDNLMVAVINFEDGPTSEPDQPHAHPHEQITYVESGEVLFFLGNESTQLGPGDMFTVSPNQPHSIQLLTKHVRLIDSFTPVREEFI